MNVDARKGRFRGALLGLATGDAVGTTLEFARPGTYAPMDDMVGGGPFALQPGEWTDDTSMALCLAESLVECGGFDAVDQLRRYVRWWKDGHLASNGRCFDIGNTTRAALTRFERTGVAAAGSDREDTAANGSIMRLAPVPLFFSHSIDEAIERSADSSRTTHQEPRAVDACRLLGALIAAAAQGTSKAQLLDPGFWRWGPLHAEIDEIARGSFKRREPPEIKGSGYVVSSLEAALWALDRSENFRDGCLLAVNLGDDADTTGAVYGQLAGAIYGEGGIPAEWRERLALRPTIEDLADRLAELPRRRAAPPTADSYWVEPGRLLCGEYPSARDPQAGREKLRRIRGAGIDFFLDLTEPDEGLRSYEAELAAGETGIEYRRLPVRDLNVPTVEQMGEILDTIDDALARGRVVYLHCWGGVGRTGTAVGCYLVRHGRTPPEAIARIAELRRDTSKVRRTSPETPAQMRFIEAWHELDTPTRAGGPRPWWAEHGFAERGSQLQVQLLVNRRPHVLTRAVLQQVPELGRRAITLAWVAPLEDAEFAEPRDGEFLRAIGRQDLAPDLAAFWPARGPVWDALALAIFPDRNPGVVLVEGKGHPAEVYGGGCKAGADSREAIATAVRRTQRWLGAPQDPDRWLDPLRPEDPGHSSVYQSANRLAHLYFLRTAGVEAWLVDLLVVGDRTHIATTRGEWAEARAKLAHELELPEAPQFAAAVLVDALDPDELLRSPVPDAASPLLPSEWKASPRLLDALAFSVARHGDQARKGGDFPYAVHPVGVAQILHRHGASEDAVVAGLLHDLVEDAGVEPETIRARFGSRVTELVLEASEPERGLPHADRKQRTVDAIAEQRDRDALRLIAADKLDNVRAMRDDAVQQGDAFWARFKRGRDAQARYYGDLACALLARAPDELLFRTLDGEVTELFAKRKL